MTSSSNHRNRLIVCSFWWNEVWNLGRNGLMTGQLECDHFQCNFMAYDLLELTKKNLPLLHIVPLVDWPCTYMECSLEREKWMHLYLSPVSSFYCKLFPTKSGLCRSSGMFAHHNCFRWCCKRNERPMEPICLSIPYNVRLFDASSK